MKRRATRIFFILLTIFTLWYLNGVLCVKSIHGVNQARALYYQPRNAIDVAMLGSSHIHCNVNTALLWKEYGIAAYDYSAAEQPMWNTYHYLVEFCKRQSPCLIVLDVYALMYEEPYQYGWMRENTLGMRFSDNKWRMLQVCVEPERLYEFFPSVAYYHNRVENLTKEDFLYPFTSFRMLRAYKGFSPYMEIEPQVRLQTFDDQVAPLTQKHETYLRKIIEYTKAHDLELALIVVPYAPDATDERIFNRVREIAEEYDVAFYNLNHSVDEIGLDFDADFNDASHLNYRGTCKFSRFFGAMLKSLYDLPDRRGEKGYASWDTHYDTIVQNAQKYGFTGYE